MRAVKLAALCFVVAVAAVVIISDELRDAWQNWFAGKLQESYPFWGADVLFWGRIGKGLQFLAGCAIILDLLPPEKLRARGVAARERLDADRERWRRLQTARRLIRLRAALIHVVILPTRRRRQFELEIRSTNYYSSVLLKNFSRSDLEEYAKTIRQGMPAGQRFPLFAANRRVVEEHIHKCTHEFLAARLPAEEYKLMDEANRLLRYRYGSVIVCVGLAVPVVAVAERGQLDQSSLGRTVVGVSVILLVIIATRAYARPEFVLALEFIRVVRYPPWLLYNALAFLLDKARPGHLLRWIGLYLFIVGFHFDMLAS